MSNHKTFLQALHRCLINSCSCDFAFAFVTHTLTHRPVPAPTRLAISTPSLPIPSIRSLCLLYAMTPEIRRQHEILATQRVPIVSDSEFFNLDFGPAGQFLRPSRVSVGFWRVMQSGEARLAHRKYDNVPHSVGLLLYA